MRHNSDRPIRTPFVESLESRRLLTTWAVNTLGDAINNTDGLLTLREAVTFANAEPNADEIRFAPGLAGNIVLTNGEITIAHGLTITGPGAPTLAVDGNDASRIFNVGAGAQVAVGDLTLKNGRVGLRQNGGGILNAGSLTLTRVVVSGNEAGDGGFSATSSGPAGGSGGGVYNTGTLTIRESAILNNASGRGSTGYDQFMTAGSGGAGGNGGGIYNASGATLTLLNSTVAGNRANDGGTGGNALYLGDGGRGGSGGTGGGLYNVGTATLVNVTVTANYPGLGGTGGFDAGGTTPGPAGSRGGGDGIANLAGAADFRIGNTISAQNNPDGPSMDAPGGYTSLGHNFIGLTYASSGWGASDKTGTMTQEIDAKLGTTFYYGGLTPTAPLLTGSPAINAGDSALAASYGLTTDQRGYVRGYGVTDIGTYEAGSGFAGDADRDGAVAFADLLSLAKNYGKAGTWTSGDFDGSGTVDFADLLTLAKNYGRSFASYDPLASAAVPFVARGVASTGAAKAAASLPVATFSVKRVSAPVAVRAVKR